MSTQVWKVITGNQKLKRNYSLQVGSDQSDKKRLKKGFGWKGSFANIEHKDYE